MALAGVDHGPALLPGQVDQRRDGRHDGFEQRDIIAEGMAEAAGLNEIALHVDHDERRMTRVEPVRIGVGRDVDHGTFLLPLAGEGAPAEWGRMREGRGAPCPLIRRRVASTPSPAGGRRDAHFDLRR